MSRNKPNGSRKCILTFEKLWDGWKCIEMFGIDNFYRNIWVGMKMKSRFVLIDEFNYDGWKFNIKILTYTTRFLAMDRFR